jgi:hypothetical protein
VRPRLAAVAAVLALAGAACGARLPGEVHAQATRAALQGHHGVVPQPSAVDDQNVGPAPTDSAGNQPVPTSGPTGARPGPDQSDQESSSDAPTPAGSTCSGGSDTGLTPTTLTLGMVASLSGPVSGLFDGAVHGSQSFANYVNHAEGGICGRQVNIAVRDDGTNCTQDQNGTQSLIARAFALVGSFALYDGCGAIVLRQHPDVVDIHVALDPAAGTPANHFDISAKRRGFATGMFKYYKDKYGAKLSRVGTIVENIPSAIEKQKDQVRAAESQGWHFVSSILEQPTNSNFQGDFVRLCQQEHITAFFELTETATNAATMIQNQRQAGCPKDLLNIIPISYDQAFIDAYGGPKSDLDGIQGYNEYALFFNKDEADNIPEVKLFQEWNERTYPGVPLNLYGMFAWASHRLFQKAAEAVEGALTRKSFMASLRRIHDFDAGGLLAPTDPVSGAPHCYLLYEIQNGTFHRVDTPKSGFRCDGHFLPNPSN